jgi:glutamate racemase
MNTASDTASAARPIGVFDSGVGGLTVVRAVRERLPAEDILYLGDTARLPYGSKSPETVVRYSLACAQFLVQRGVKLVLIACNTASAHALGALRASLGVPVLGAVEPGAHTALAASTSGHIGVIGTLGTVRSGAYAHAIRAMAPEAVVSGQACPLLVPLAEEGWTEDDIAFAIARRYLGELAARDPKIDTLVLGCTHYPLLVPVLRRAAAAVFDHPVTLVDSATAMAAAAHDVLAARGELRRAGAGASGRGRLECFVTDASRLDDLAPLFLGQALDGYAAVDLGL